MNIFDVAKSIPRKEGMETAQRVIRQVEERGTWLWSSEGKIQMESHRGSLPIGELNSQIVRNTNIILLEILSRQNARSECLEVGHCVFWPECDLFPVQPGVCKKRSAQKAY
ncbi:Hypothetical protein DEACI_3133 [Acididesulfobacillus acetoxydans]|uniref:Uncharacterized protein n=1 Tax=Acididesulfobacillus acetoxydans TaxID=1561005 RepID=A0A8S0W9B3_9FIRM|nr:Hypothetical protein DEACI_3133 [Acididesulfobacillus acetoxydans]CEJ05914.1 Hypothetical protein DEACI_0334 [Acididesulfobacillus acetoxydans]